MWNNNIVAQLAIISVFIVLLFLLQVKNDKIDNWY